MRSIIVVCGLFFDETGKVLMTLRKETQVPPSRWENPGGKVEDGETEREALTREMREELGVEVGIGELISTASFIWDDRLHMLLYHCWIKKGTPQPLESQEVRWVDPRYARQKMPCLPACYVWYPDIVSFIDRYLH